MKKIFLLGFLVFSITACEEGGDAGSSVATCTKGITSNWVHTEANFNFDYTDMTLEQLQEVVLNFSGGEQCTLRVRITGSECVGQHIVSESTSTGSPAFDCGLFLGTDNYVIQGETLEMCDANDSSACGTFQ